MPATRLDQPEFAELFDRATPTLRLVAAAEVGRAHADDVVQQAAIIALQRLDRFEAGTDFRAWMAAITRGAARNHRRSEQARGRRERTPRLLPRRQPKPADNPTFEQHAPLFDALAELSPAQRECLLLRVVGEHTYEEIATILDIPAATARSHTYRARAHLLERLESRGDTP
ncbi:MAG: sigma-70 family RNA polymerase sigma factor [Phycisphaera sp.]|nr:MAG: sigma-70 family RNA polymerase sigma factor [Phycisphaera sp.]